MCFVGLDICINLPEVGLFKGQGFFSAIGYVLTILLGVLLVIWVGYSIYAGYKIVSSSMAKGLEEGVNIIKNIWIGITMGLAFFAVISVIGGMLGIGDITRWHTNLSQCHDATGGFYFKDVQEQAVLGFPEDTSMAYCCKVTNIAGAGLDYEHVSFKDGTYHYVLTTSGSAPSAGFEECVKF